MIPNGNKAEENSPIGMAAYLCFESPWFSLESNQDMQTLVTGSSHILSIYIALDNKKVVDRSITFYAHHSKHLITNLLN